MINFTFLVNHPSPQLPHTVFVVVRDQNNHYSSFRSGMLHSYGVRCDTLLAVHTFCLYRSKGKPKSGKGNQKVQSVEYVQSDEDTTSESEDNDPATSKGN